MNIREAILKAADHIGNNPDGFTLANICVPYSWDGQGCALGRIFQALGKPAGKLCSEFCMPVLGCKEGEFFNRMSNMLGGETAKDHWLDNGIKCAKALRLYADKYHSAEPSKKSGSDIAREIMNRPYNDKETANA